MGQLAKCHQGSGDDDGNKYAKRRVEVDSPTVLSRMMPKFANTLLIKKMYICDQRFKLLKKI